GPRCGMGGARLAVPGVRSTLVDRVGDRLVEEHLAGVHHRAADVHLEVDVGRPAAVPAGEDRVEEDLAVRVALLVAAQEAPAVVGGGVTAAAGGRTRSAVAGVHAAGVRVPDLDVGAADRLAGGGVLHREV